MFSTRLEWNLRPNRLSELLQAKRASGATLLDLTESNPTRAGFIYPSEQILHAFHDPRALHYEPTPAGLTTARDAVAGYYAARGQQVSPECILLTVSTSEAYSYIFKLLADPGDEVLVPRPSYPLFDYLAALESLRPVPYSLAYDGNWRVDFDALRRAVTPRTRAVVLVNPNNPTGSYIKKQELETLLPICAEHGLAIVSDEVFSDYAFAPDPHRVQSLAGVEEVLTFCLSGLSKIAGLPQMKAGWIVTGGPQHLLAQARERLELIADTYLSVSTPVQHALPQLLSLGEGLRKQIIGRVRENMRFLENSVRGTACHALHAEGGWYAILQVPRTRSEEDWCLALLERENVLVQPGFFYDFDVEAFLVVSLLTQPETFQEGMERLLAELNSNVQFDDF
ncbi:MAG: hypothetical protein A3F68_09640 [Acidobacteria bacterium RIFCSPLOWO2_12_FULL_54_10]|nr:MAG: hypothetical protein A3F68_09640 [Acidobacteria bacterium RIFCSPLOWO2_12_FULL_54_10]